MSFIVSPKLELSNGPTPIMSLLHVIPSAVAGKGEDEVNELPITVGDARAKLGDHFDIETNSLTSEGHDSWPDLLFRGDFSHVNHLGARMQKGRLLIVGDAGSHVGAQMSGGELRVEGNVRDFVGAEMSGGRIRISGNAGDYVGGACAGSKLGMNRGEIVIGGDAGKAVGFRMRRGTILAKSVGHNCGWQMRAGTIGFDRAEGLVGIGMVRGTIVSLSPECEIPWPFSPSFVGLPPAAGILREHWGELNSDLANGLTNATFHTFHGDHLAGGKGEIWVANLE